MILEDRGDRDVVSELPLLNSIMNLGWRQ